MENWAAEADRERDEQEIRRRQMNISILKEKYQSMPLEDLGERRAILIEIRKKCNSLIFELDEGDERLQDAYIDRDWAQAEQIKVTEEMIKEARKKENERDDI